MKPNQNLGTIPQAMVAQSSVELLKAREARKASRSPRFNERERRFLNKILLGLGIAGASGLALAIGLKVAKKIDRDSTLKNADDLTKPEGIAYGIFDAMKGWGTDEEKLYGMLRRVPHQVFFNRVKADYRKFEGTGDALIEDMRSDLSDREFSKAIGIINSYPLDERGISNTQVTGRMLEAWAERLYLGFGYENSYFHRFQIDIDEIYAVMNALPLARTAIQLDRVYREKSGEGLLPELQFYLETSQLHEVIRIIKSKSDAQGKRLDEIFA